MTIITRFAPSPTGYLHVGNFRTAFINWLFARKNGGKFILRLDDTDTNRSKDKYSQQIKQDLQWVGLDWQQEFRQIHRLEHYETIKQQLINEGRLYPCFESQEELAVKRKFQLSAGKPPIYDRNALKLSTAQIEELISQGKKPHYRFKLDHSTISWQDMVRGETIFEGENLSDPIVIREDQSFTYMLCSVIDDIDYNITHIIRGEDHVTNTAMQAQMFEALNAKIPEFGHVALIKSPEGEMSKRSGGNDLKSLREEFHIHPMALANIMAKLGTCDPISYHTEMQQLIEEFDINKFSRATAIYDQQEIININHKIISQLSFEEIQDDLLAIGIENPSPSIWELIKGNVNNISEYKKWQQIIEGDIDNIIEDQEFIKQARELLPAEPWEENIWQEWTAKLKENTNRKGKSLFMPLRKALTGLDYGPEMNRLLPLLGRKKTLERLND